MDAQKAKTLLANDFMQTGGDVTDAGAFEGWVDLQASMYQGSETDRYIKAATVRGHVAQNSSIGGTKTMSTQPIIANAGSIEAEVNASQAQRSQVAAATTVTTIYVDKKSAMERLVNVKNGLIDTVKDKNTGAISPAFERQIANLQAKGWTLVPKGTYTYKDGKEEKSIEVDSENSKATAQKAYEAKQELPIGTVGNSHSIVGVDLSAPVKANTKQLSVKAIHGLQAFLAIYTNGVIEAANPNALGIRLRRTKNNKFDGNITNGPEYKTSVAFVNKEKAIKSGVAKMFTKEDAKDGKTQTVKVDSQLPLLFSKVNDKGKTIYKLVYIKLAVSVPAQVRKPEFEKAFGKSQTGFSDKNVNSAHAAVSDILRSLSDQANFADAGKLSPADQEALRKLTAATAGGAAMSLD